MLSLLLSLRDDVSLSHPCNGGLRETGTQTLPHAVREVWSLPPVSAQRLCQRQPRARIISLMTTSLEETSQGGGHRSSLLQVRDASAALALQAWLDTFPAERRSESPRDIVLCRMATGYGQIQERKGRR